MSSSLPSIISRRGARNSLHLLLLGLPVLFLTIPKVRHQNPTKIQFQSILVEALYSIDQAPRPEMLPRGITPEPHE